MSVTICQTEKTFDVNETNTPSTFGHHSVSSIACSFNGADPSRMTPVGHNGGTAGTSRQPQAIRTLTLDSPASYNHARAAHVRGTAHSTRAPAEADGGILRVSAMHSRSRSEAVPTPSRSPKAADERRAFRRQRNLSAAESPYFLARDAHRLRPPSALSAIVSPTLAPAVLHTPQDELELLGSFTPTSSSRRSLQSILTAAHPPDSSLRASRHWNDSGPYGVTSICGFAQTPQCGSSPPPDSPTIPSICRTPSSYTESEYFPSAPSSAGPPTPAREHSQSPLARHRSLHPVLESLEDASKFSVQACCATCKRAGSNFPCCPKCGEMWCSRQCRLESNGGKKHVCRKSY